MQKEVSPTELQRIYELRFTDLEYRKKIWAILVCEFFSRYVRKSDVVLDLGCGYGEFINQVVCAKKYGMDLNPDSAKNLLVDVHLLSQDCSHPWDLPEASLDVVFTSNFFEHLPTKPALDQTLEEARRALRPGGTLIAMGPNIRIVPGKYWDFWDHHLPLSDRSLTEALANKNFQIARSIPRFLPYTMATGPKYPPFFLKIYLQYSFLWRLFGEQFLVIATKNG